MAFPLGLVGSKCPLPSHKTETQADKKQYIQERRGEKKCSLDVATVIFLIKAHSWKLVQSVANSHDVKRSLFVQRQSN